jgi:hypothetical protein
MRGDYARAVASALITGVVLFAALVLLGR